MKNRLVQIGLTAAMLLILIEVVLIAPQNIRDAQRRESAPASVPAEPAGNPAADQTMNGMHMIETQEGGKEWELWSDQATSVKAKELIELRKVKAIFYGEKGVTFTVTGARGRVEVKSKNLRVEGDVVTRSSNGYVFKTPAMNYESGDRILRAPNRVEMTGPRDEHGRALKLTGSVMEASLPRSTMEVRRDVKAEKALDRSRAALIRSQRSLFSGKDRTARFLGDVVLDLDAMRMTGPAADFEYDGKGQTVRAVNFPGGARVSDSDKWATADSVRVEFESNRFVFHGHPRVVQNNDELRGEEIIFLDGGKRVQVRAARALVDEQRAKGKH